MRSYYLLTTFILLLIIYSALGIYSECDNYGNFSTHLSKRSAPVSYTNTISLKSLSKVNEDKMSGRDFEKAPLPLPTEVLDELFGRRLFNTTMNYIVPMFHVLLPLHTDTGSTIHLAMQAFLGLFSAIAWISTIAIPLFLTELKPFGLRKRSSNFGNPFSFSTEKFKSLFNDEIATKIGLGWDPCLCKTVCEAHRDPKRYNLLALPFLILFPPLSEKDLQSYNIIQKRRKAASDGLHSDEDCGKMYPCFFDVLDLIKYIYNLL